MPSESKADSSSIFASINRAEMTVVGAYPFLHTQELGYQLLMGTDESSSTETNSKYVMSNYDYTNLTGMLNSTYTTMYKAIEYANVSIANLPDMQASSDAEQRKIDALGESLAIRAYAYWNWLFLRHAIRTEPTAQLTTFSSSRISRDTIWDQCVTDLQRAIELLPEERRDGGHSRAFHQKLGLRHPGTCGIACSRLLVALGFEYCTLQ